MSDDMTSARPSHDDLRRWDRAHYWHAFTQMSEYDPFIIERAEGHQIFDIAGNAYIDGASSMWCNILGHRHPRIDAAVREQLDRVAHVTSLGMSNPTTIQLAKKLADVTPGNLEHVFFSDSGATSVEVAIKMALQYWRQCPNPQPKKTKYIAYGEAYHGDTIGVVSVSGVARFQSVFGPLLFPVHRLPLPGTYRVPDGSNEQELCAMYLAQLEELLKKEHEEVAALVIEPLVQCAAGIVTHPRGYLRGVRELTQKYDVLMIADEVAVGMGHTGTLFACEQENVVPDFLCLAKGLTGGYMPLAATITSARIFEAFLGTFAESKTFFHGHTYGGNPLGAAAALATLEILETEQILGKMEPKVAHLRSRLARIAEHPNVGDVRQCGLIGGIELVKDKRTKEPFPWEEKRGWKVCAAALERGVWVRPLGSVVPIFPALTITLEELDQICDAVEYGLTKVFDLQG